MLLMQHVYIKSKAVDSCTFFTVACINSFSQSGTFTQFSKLIAFSADCRFIIES